MNRYCQVVAVWTCPPHPFSRTRHSNTTLMTIFQVELHGNSAENKLHCKGTTATVVDTKITFQHHSKCPLFFYPTSVPNSYNTSTFSGCTNIDTNIPMISAHDDIFILCKNALFLRKVENPT